MIQGLDPAWLLVGLAAVAGAGASVLLAAGWLRRRRSLRTSPAGQVEARRSLPAPSAEDPVLASMGLPAGRGRRRDR